jgi:hypothetical protein
MKKIILLLVLLPTMFSVIGQSKGKIYNTKDFALKSGSVKYNSDLELLIFEFSVEGLAGNTFPKPVGKMDGAPVLGYVFPTTLKAEDVGFSKTEGIVALAVTSHPDFDDSPFWDENNDGIFDNDGLTYHTHWVVLVEDTRVPGKLAVKEFHSTEKVTLPKTSAGMHMYMDSPGYNVVLKEKTGRVVVPVARINQKKNFNYDVVTAYMEVNANDHSRPMLGVYEVFGVLSGNLSLPYSVNNIQ